MEPMLLHILLASCWMVVSFVGGSHEIFRFNLKMLSMSAVRRIFRAFNVLMLCKVRTQKTGPQNIRVSGFIGR